MHRYVIIRNGKIDFHNIVLNNIDLNLLIKYLKRRRVNNIESIDLLMIFHNKLYFLKKSVLSITLIVNGNIMYFNLLKINKNMRWLKKTLEASNVKISSILYSVYINGRLYIIKSK